MPKKSLKPSPSSPKSEVNKKSGKNVSHTRAAARNPHILLVEDDVQLADMLAESLSTIGMKTDVYYNAETAFTFFENKSADLILVDILLPGQDGLKLIEKLRKDLISIPIIFLTALDSDEQKIKGLNLGGDDYITKPFNFDELVARIYAVLRRTESAQVNRLVGDLTLPEGTFAFCGSIVDPKRQEIIFPDGAIEKIGRKESGILYCLYESRGTVLRRRLLLRKVWGMAANFRSRSLDQYIVKIRDQLQAHGCSVEKFNTVHGIGYLYDPEGKIVDHAPLLHPVGKRKPSKKKNNEQARRNQRGIEFKITKVG